FRGQGCAPSLAAANPSASLYFLAFTCGFAARTERNPGAAPAVGPEPQLCLWSGASSGQTSLGAPSGQAAAPGALLSAAGSGVRPRNGPEPFASCRVPWARGCCWHPGGSGRALAVPCLRSNIIDVSAADSQGMEQHEYMDRARQYSTRLAMLSNNLTHWKKLPLLPSLTNQPHQVLASDPVPFADLQQVSRIAAYAFSALSQIRVDAKEELVVQFGIP
ncbi:ragulator complex protein LAMTOR1, partial [Cygnus olor]|uniref:ragulator complex protein LAMTOR1 n=1 Tax=Cygnus olor TaxID=8869 RepID=UPI001ADE8C54